MAERPVKRRRNLSGVREIHPDEYVITSEPRPKGGAERAWRKLREMVLGPAIPSGAEKHERLNVFTGLAILGADNIASSVYGPEEMMRALAMAGTGALLLARPIGAAIVALLIILAISYQQTIRAYPSGAGGYIVASANLGALLGIVSAAALIVDYSLDVAVSIATGVQSVTSAVPGLASGRLPFALGVLAFMMLMNLRGIRTSGAVFALPIYAYILGALGVLVIGFIRWGSGSLPHYEAPASAAEAISSPTAALGLMLIMRAFASGAVALTGIEAVSNGIPYFKPPETRHARHTLVLMASIFAVLFLGISLLGAQLRVVPDPNEVETVVSQLTRTFMGRGPYYYGVQAATFVLLILAADTGFADFPRLLSLLARDHWLPEQFAFRGRRLAFSNGIVLVTLLSGVLMFIFHASVSNLVPLFAI
ncbi:MAG TPA: APC family permease, partial [Chloroflexota bacterium]